MRQNIDDSNGSTMGFETNIREQREKTIFGCCNGQVDLLAFASCFFDFLSIFDYFFLAYR